jgi:hypothetical protein
LLSGYQVWPNVTPFPHVGHETEPLDDHSFVGFLGPYRFLICSGRCTTCQPCCRSRVKTYICSSSKTSILATMKSIANLHRLSACCSRTNRCCKIFARSRRRLSGVLRARCTGLVPIAAGILRAAETEWLALTPASRCVGGTSLGAGVARGERGAFTTGAITPPA